MTSISPGNFCSSSSRAGRASYAARFIAIRASIWLYLRAIRSGRSLTASSKEAAALRFAPLDLFGAEMLVHLELTELELVRLRPRIVSGGTLIERGWQSYRVGRPLGRRDLAFCD